MSDIEKKVEETEVEATETEKKVEKKTDDKVKAKKKDKPSLFSRIGAWFKGFKAEFKKIVWTSPRTVLINSLVVIVCVAVVAAVIGLLDYVFSTSIVGLSRLI